MKYLVEFVNWINKINEDTHLIESVSAVHPEDMVILGGKSLHGVNYPSLKDTATALLDVANNPSKNTISLTSSTILVFGKNRRGEFSILDQQMFDDRSSVNTVTSPEEFAKAESKHHHKNNVRLTDTVREIWPDLAASYDNSKVKGWFTAYLLFNSPLKNDDGYYRFKPDSASNIYEIAVNSAIGSQLTNKRAGLAVKDYLPPDAKSTDDRNINMDTVSILNAVKTNVALIPSVISVAPDISISKPLAAKIKDSVQSSEQISSFFNSAPVPAEPLTDYFISYIKAKLISSNLKSLVVDFIPWVERRIGGSLTTPQNKEVLDYLKKNSDTINLIFKNWVNFYNFKMQILAQLDAASAASSKNYLEPGKESHEGFVHDGFKFVDRIGSARGGKPGEIANSASASLAEQDLEEADNPNYFGGSSMSAIPGTPPDLLPQPDPEEIKKYHREMASLKKFMGH